MMLAMTITWATDLNVPIVIGCYLMIGFGAWIMRRGE